MRHANQRLPSLYGIDAPPSSQSHACPLMPSHALSCLVAESCKTRLSHALFHRPMRRLQRTRISWSTPAGCTRSAICSPTRSPSRWSSWWAGRLLLLPSGFCSCFCQAASAPAKRLILFSCALCCCVAWWLARVEYLQDVCAWVSRGRKKGSGGRLGQGGQHQAAPKLPVKCRARGQWGAHSAPPRLPPPCRCGGCATPSRGTRSTAGCGPLASRCSTPAGGCGARPGWAAGGLLPLSFCPTLPQQQMGARLSSGGNSSSSSSRFLCP